MRMESNRQRTNSCLRLISSPSSNACIVDHVKNVIDQRDLFVIGLNRELGFSGSHRCVRARSVFSQEDSKILNNDTMVERRYCIWQKPQDHAHDHKK